MLFVFIGNLAAGKSTLCKKLSQDTGWKYLPIDDFRKAHKSKEAYLYALETIKVLPGPIIFECAGTHSMLKNILQQCGKPFRIILIPVDKKTSIKRHEERIKNGYTINGFDETKYTEAINEIDIKLKNILTDYIYDQDYPKLLNYINASREATHIR